MIWLNDCFADAPMIDTKVTSASPIISADAVVAVRRGLRIAFSRASTPDVPRKRAGNPTGHSRHRTRHQRAQHRDPDEHEERRDADHARRPARHGVGAHVAEQTERGEQDPDEGEQAPDPVAPRAARGDDNVVAHRGDRRHSRCAPGR